MAPDFETGVLLAVNHDGDSDSTGAITGNLLGTLHGVGAIPAPWIEELEARDVIEAVDDLGPPVAPRALESRRRPMRIS